MECERYQDCSWFQQDWMKESLNNKLSLAETAEPIIDINEFDLEMQYALGHTIPMGENYLEVLDDVLLEKNYKLEEKSKNNLNTSESNAFSDFKMEENNACDTLNNFYGLKKTDSFDSMEYISSTDPAEILPISLMECINSSNSNLAALNGIKCEVKSELDLSPSESESQLLPSDESDLNIGREEIVGEAPVVEITEQVNNTAIDFKLDQLLQPVVPTDESFIGSNLVPGNDFKSKGRQDSPIIKAECLGMNNNTLKQDLEKVDLNLNLSKVNFEQSINVNTPDLEFMDLVDFINEVRQFFNALFYALFFCVTKFFALIGFLLHNFFNIYFQDVSKVYENESVSQVDSLPEVNTKTSSPQCKIENSNAVSQQKSQTKSQDVQVISSTSSASNSSLKGSSNVEVADLLDESTSIAERIKTKAKRRVAKRYSIIENSSASEEENDEFFESNDDQRDDDYEYGGSVSKRKCAPLKEKLKSLEYNNNCKKDKDTLEKIDSYRERRDKNNEASRRSRQNRKDRERHMFQTLEEEERRNVKLKAEAEVLERQVTSLRKLLLQAVLRKPDGT